MVAYFVATSSAFFKGVILPRASKALNATITVSDASVSPFRQVVLHNLKVQTAGSEPLVTAPEVRLRYSLMDILGGNIHVDEATLRPRPSWWLKTRTAAGTSIRFSSPRPRRPPPRPGLLPPSPASRCKSMCGKSRLRVPPFGMSNSTATVTATPMSCPT